MAKHLVIFSRAANLDVARASRDKSLASVPWKLQAARLSYALAVWRESSKILPKARYPEAVTSLAVAGIAMLSSIEDRGGGADTTRDVEAINNLAKNNQPKAWTESPPKSAQLYSDDPNSVLPFAAPAVAPKTPVDPKLTTPDATKTPDPKAVDPKLPASPKKQ